MVPFCRLRDALSEVPDPRRAEGKRYPLAPLLLFTVLALLSGATSYRHIICFLEQRRIVLNALFGCTLKRAPSLNTLRTVLQMLDRDALEEAFRQHAQGLLAPAELGRMPVVALDGKTLKGSFDHLNDQKAAQALSAFASDAAILLAHTEIDVKSNEIPAAQQMIAVLGLSGVLFTADALHCQKGSIRVSGWWAAERPKGLRAKLCPGIWRCARIRRGRDSRAASPARCPGAAAARSAAATKHLPWC
jgi:predicted transposase YbfD/YdcC